MVIRKVVNEFKEDGAESFWCFYELFEWGLGKKSLICEGIQFGALLCWDVKVKKLKSLRVLLPVTTPYLYVWKLRAIEWLWEIKSGIDIKI